MPKRFFWIKLKDSFFKQLAIKKLRKVAGGDTHVIIYLKMMLLAMNDEGRISYECNDEAEFAENLALELDEQEDNVKLTLAFLKGQKLIEYITDTEVFLPEVEGCIGSESESAARKRKSRANQAKMLECCDNSVTKSQECHENVTLEKEIDIEKDKDIDIEKESKPKGRTQKNKSTKTKVQRKKYGRFKNIDLSDNELEAFRAMFPDDWERYLDEVSGYIGEGKTKKGVFTFLENWGNNDYQRLNRGKNTNAKTDKPTITVEDALAKLVI